MLKSGCCASFRTWSTVSARCAAACSANHLSITSAIALETIVEGVERHLPFGRVESRRGCRARPAGRSYCPQRRIAPWRARAAFAGSAAAMKSKRNRAKAANALRVGRQVVARCTGGVVRREKLVRATPCRSRHAAASRASCTASVSTTFIRSAISAFARQQDRFGLERRVQRVRPERRADRAHDGLKINVLARAPAMSAPSLVPASPRSARMGRCRPAPVARARPSRRSAMTIDRRREIAVDREQRRFGRHSRTSSSASGWSSTISRSGAISAPLSLADQRGPERDRHRLFYRLAGRRLLVLFEVQGRASSPRRHARAARVTLGVPAWLYQILNGSGRRRSPSSSACTKSSQVAALPSWRSK